MNLQKKLTDQILINDNKSIESATSYIPIVIYECNRDKSDQKNIEIVVSDVEIDNFTKSTIVNKAYTEFADLKWIQKSVPTQEIKSEFGKLYSTSAKSSRIKEFNLNYENYKQFNFSFK